VDIKRKNAEEFLVSMIWLSHDLVRGYLMGILQEGKKRRKASSSSKKRGEFTSQVSKPSQGPDSVTEREEGKNIQFIQCCHNARVQKGRVVGGYPQKRN